MAAFVETIMSITGCTEEEASCLKDASDGNMERAVNFFYDGTLSRVKKSSASVSTAADPVIKRKALSPSYTAISNMDENIVNTTPSSSSSSRKGGGRMKGCSVDHGALTTTTLTNNTWPKALPSIAVEGYSTVRGANIVKLDDDLLISREISKSKLEQKQSGAGSNKAPSSSTANKGAVPQFYKVKRNRDLGIRIRVKRGNVELGRISNADLAEVMAPLMDSNIIEVSGKYLWSPVETLSHYSQIHFLMTIHLTKEAFLLSKEVVSGGNAEDTEAYLLNEALYKLLYILLCRPKGGDMSGGSTSSNPIVIDDSVPVPPVKKAKPSPKPSPAVTQPSIYALSKRSTKGDTVINLTNADGEEGEEEGELKADEVSLLYKEALKSTLSLPTLEQPKSLQNISLKSYQQQALYWMVRRESVAYYSKDGRSIEYVADEDEDKGFSKGLNMHPLWQEHGFADGSKFYINLFASKVQLEFPLATKICKGGILADEMGMGKTIEMLALLLHQMEKEGKRKSGSGTGGTLLVVPMVMISQWRDEIEKFSKHYTTVGIHYGADRQANNLPSYDIVITSYGTLASDWTTANNNSKLASPLHTVNWRRVVLDEAHTIKNTTTTMYKAAFALSADRRWCLTGTPLQNSLEDLYALLSFLRHEPWSERNWWKKTISDPYSRMDQQGQAMGVLQQVLSDVCLRRTKDMNDLDGRPIVSLPHKEVNIVKIELSVAERNFYRALFTRSKIEYQGFVAAGNLASKYAQMLGLLLRLRQTCDHPFLVLGRNHQEKTKVESSRESAAISSTTGDGCEDGNVILKEAYIGELFREFMGAADDGDDERMTVASEASAVSLPVVSTFAKQQISELYKEGIDSKECPVCLEWCDRPVLTPCMHLFCHECLLSCLINGAGECPSCCQDIQYKDLIKLSSDTGALASTSKEGGEGSDVKDIKSETSVSKSLPVFDGKASKEIPWKPSAKIDWVMENLPQLHKADGEKIIIFSQWTHMLDLLEIAMKKSKVPFLRLDGSMSQSEREKVLSRFGKEDSEKVMLLSLKAAGVGLNLVQASIVILLDPWYNPAVEEQAIDRVHRLGQKRRVSVYRLIVSDTVEEGMLALQERKRKLAMNALSGGISQANKLKLDDLVAFFK